jgi:L-serine deaminase|tara:strand:- start:16 stop:252 length:237 start_codon:yes stop_codon:yes gene_type:complete
MAKVIAEKASDVVNSKNVEIKHTKVMKDAAGKNVTVVDWVDVRPVDAVISEAEAELVTAEARVTELKADIVEYKKIKG